MLEVYDDELDCRDNMMMEICIDAYNRSSLMDMTMMMRKTMTMMKMTMMKMTMMTMMIL